MSLSFQPKIHTLASGATVLSLSAHPFRFSDDTVSEPQIQEIVERLTLGHTLLWRITIKDMKVNWTRMWLSTDQAVFLTELCHMADLVILPFSVLVALREQGIRDRYPNAVAFNATAETQRSAPDAKIVDIDNWSY